MDIAFVSPHNPIDESFNFTKPFDPTKIDIITKQVSVDSLIKRLKHAEINLLTGFQRKGDLWDSATQSRLIESLLIRFPLPAFYFDGTDDDKWLIVDGLQRLNSIHNFCVSKTLKLTGVEYLRNYEGYSFDDLPRSMQRIIEEAQVTVYIINPGTPELVKYNIFKRINTGGLTLEPQEIRHAVYQGVPADLVKELAESPEFIRATCGVIKKERMQDRDFVTRFIAFYLMGYAEYQPDLDSFMNAGMSKINNLDQNELALLKLDFKKAMRYAWEIFGQDAFRKRLNLNDSRNAINKALFDTWSVNLSKLNDVQASTLVAKKDELIYKFIRLMSEGEFFRSISTGTGDKGRVETRFKRIKEIIENTL